MDRAKIVLLILSFFALLSCGGDSGQRATLQSVVVSPASVSLQVQATQQFKATGSYTDGSSQDLTRSFTWTSSDDSVVTVSNAPGSQGLAKMMASGTARITAAAASGTGKGSATVAVTSPVTISISPTFASLTLTQTQQFNATVKGVTNTAVTWSVDGTKGGNSTVGTLSDTGLYTPPQTRGTHAIAAASQFDPAKTASAQTAIMDYAGTFTHRSDGARSGQNLSEFVLTPQNVNASQFGKLFSYPVDGIIYAQPLYAANLSIPGQGYHNVIYLATTNDTVYAFDADGRSASPLWKVSLLTNSGAVPCPCQDEAQACDFYGPQIGVTGTPAIDTSTGTLYVSAFTKENGSYAHHLHALDVTTGAEKFGGPVLISGSVSGTGTAGDGQHVVFDPYRHLQRSGILLAGGRVYVAFASYADIGPYHGWLFGYDAKTLQQTTIWNVTPNGGLGGIWQGGAAPAVDADGNIYVVTGNGTFTADTGGSDYSDSVLKLQAVQEGLKVIDYFTPYDQEQMRIGDRDLGSGGALLLPDQPGPHPHLLMTAGKNGSIYLIDRDNMGKFHAGDDSQIVQSLSKEFDLVFGLPGLWQNWVYFQVWKDVIKMYALNNGTLATTPVSQGQTPTGWPGVSPVVSADGTTNGIVWVASPDNVQPGFRGDSATPMLLRAYDASDVSKELYNSGQMPTRDLAGPAVKFQIPTVANAKVYVGADHELDAYGLLPR
jgi:Bacterial Ig-like domain (group 2)